MSQALRNYDEAYELEKAYRWLDAEKIYDKISAQIEAKEDLLRAADICERIGLCYHRAAFQSVSNNDFTRLMGLASQSYEKAYGLYKQLKGSVARAKQLRYQARALYLRSSVEKATSTKRALLDESLRLGIKSLGEWERPEANLEYLDTCNDFLSHVYARSELAQNYKEIQTLMEEAIEYGEAAIKGVPEDVEREKTVYTHHLLSLVILDKPMDVYESVEKQQEVMKKSLDNANKAYEIAEQLGETYIIGRTSGVLSYLTIETKWDLESSLKYAKNQYEAAKVTNDNLLKAQASELLGYLTSWKTNTTDEDPEIQLSENKKAFNLAEDAIKHYNLISKPIKIAYMNHIGSYNNLVKNEVKIEKKREILIKGISVAKQDLEEARKSGSMLGTLYILNELTYLFYGLINYAKDDDEKRKLIEEAEIFVEELIEISNKLQPYRYWNQSIFKHHSANLKIEHSKIESNEQKKKELLIKALSEGDECTRLGKIHLDMYPSKFLLLDYALALKKLGALLDFIYAVTKDAKYFERSLNVYRQALQIYRENDLLCRVAEIHWKIGSIYNINGEFLNSAKEFDLASKYYKDTIDKRPHLESFYLDYSNYMKAWSEINKAKQYNINKQYKKVKEYYENASELHKATKKWNYLYKNYLSWAKLSEAEDLSQREKSLEAKNLFQKVADMFEESKQNISVNVKNLEVKEEQLMALSLIKASELRRDYCVGRMTLEEAKILNGQGEDALSSRKYDETIRIFQAIMDSMNTEQEREEIIPIIYLCKAWKMMTLAEAERFPEHYNEASNLFEKAKDNSFTPDTKLLAQGHSYFCKALYESSKFESTRDLDSYKATSKYLTNAANYYVRAGYDRALEYSKATQRLFDAYVYLDNANGEINPEQKAKYYTLAEKVLKASADSFKKARYPVKSEEVNRILKNVRKDQRFSLSLAKVARAPIISSSTASFNVPSSSSEYAVGLESFEHANIQASMHLKSNDITTSDFLEIVISLSNTGKSSASLVKIEDIVSEKLQAAYVSSYYAFNERYIDLKGKKLGPLSTEEITIRLNPQSKGEYSIKPRVVYHDDTGEYKFCDVEAVDIKISDMGLSGWFRGRRVKPQKKDVK